MFRDEFVVTVIGVPKRSEYIDKLVGQLFLMGFKDVSVFMDFDYKGAVWNSRKMYSELANRDLKDKYVLVLTDDVYFKQDFEKELLDILNKYHDFDCLSLFSNKDLSKKEKCFDDRCVVGRGNDMYDVALVYNKNVLNRELCQEMLDLNENSSITRERNHFDMAMAKVFNNRNFRCVVPVPTLCLTQDIPSVLGHNLKYKETVAEYESKIKEGLDDSKHQ